MPRFNAVSFKSPVRCLFEHGHDRWTKILAHARYTAFGLLLTNPPGKGQGQLHSHQLGTGGGFSGLAVYHLEKIRSAGWMSCLQLLLVMYRHKQFCITFATTDFGATPLFEGFRCSYQYFSQSLDRPEHPGPVQPHSVTATFPAAAQPHQSAWHTNGRQQK